MQFTTGEIAVITGGKLVGDAGVVIRSLARIEEGEPGSLTFLHNPQYEPFLYSCRSSAVLVPNGFVPQQPLAAVRIELDNPYAGFAQLLQHVQQLKLPLAGRHATAVVAPSARVADDVFLGALSFVGEDSVIEPGAKVYPQVFIGRNVRIGAGSILYPQVVVLDDCVVGQRCILHSGCVIGSDGFGYLPSPSGGYEKIPQLGHVVLEDDVEVGANTTIDRATLGATRIRRGVKLDNLVQIAHNVELGEHTAIAAQSGISGSTKLGRHCRIAGQVGIAGHLTLAEGTQLGAKSGVAKSITTPGQAMRGQPVQPLRQQLRMEAMMRQLPDILDRLEQLERHFKHNENEP